jgi:hypothetical protein
MNVFQNLFLVLLISSIFGLFKIIMVCKKKRQDPFEVDFSKFRMMYDFWSSQFIKVHEITLNTFLMSFVLQ